jgi:predicted metalloenzyme YecM
LYTTTILNHEIFLKTFLEKVNKSGINVTDLQLDHIAYYTSSKEEYDKLKPEFSKIGDFDHEAIISNRRVGVVKLYDPIKYLKHSIEAFELIEPKYDEIKSSGWEHAEFVINEDFESFMKRYQNIKWETSSINRPIYSHITAILDDKTKVKFHHKSILECIDIERNNI